MAHSSFQFDANDLFPLVSADISYAEAQKHSALVDVSLGLAMDEIEIRIATKNAGQDQNLWYGLPTQTLLTPYTELRQILNQLSLKPHERIVDLGAAYGRLGFVVAKHAPGVSFTGYEMVPERVAEGERCFLAHALPPDIELLEADLSASDFKPIVADAYFLYDYGSRRAIDKTLQDLAEIRSEKKFRVVGRGRAVRDAIERKFPWLSVVHPPQHFAHYSIYQS